MRSLSTTALVKIIGMSIEKPAKILNIPKFFVEVISKSRRCIAITG